MRARPVPTSVACSRQVIAAGVRARSMRLGSRNGAELGAGAVEGRGVGGRAGLADSAPARKGRPTRTSLRSTGGAGRPREASAATHSLTWLCHCGPFLAAAPTETSGQVDEREQRRRLPPWGYSEHCCAALQRPAKRRAFTPNPSKRRYARVSAPALPNQPRRRGALQCSAVLSGRACMIRSMPEKSSSMYDAETIFSSSFAWP